MSQLVGRGGMEATELTKMDRAAPHPKNYQNPNVGFTEFLSVICCTELYLKKGQIQAWSRRGKRKWHKQWITVRRHSSKALKVLKGMQVLQPSHRDVTESRFGSRK